jgi:MarR-like DNA-binding transcriptional regulator SgrR of sgrS sRNA
MAQIFEQVAEEVAKHTAEDSPSQVSDNLLRQLDVKARRVIALFAQQKTIRSTDVAGILGVSTRQARNLLSQWVEAGWLDITDPSKKGRKYSLTEKYQEML